MSKYELMVVVDVALSQDEKDSVLKEATDAVQKSEGKVINSQVWQDKHKFTFLMKKKTHGTYYLINFESPANGLTKIRDALRLNERVLRSLIVKSEE